MLRTRLKETLKQAMKDGRKAEVSTLRLILAALKDRDIAARTDDRETGIEDTEIESMLQSMIKQRRESVALYEQGGRLDMAEDEKREINVIAKFLPKQMDEAAIESAVQSAISEADAKGVKDMGRVMAILRQRHQGSMDFAKAGVMARKLLA